MAGDWIKMRTALAHDPAVIAIALDLDKSEFEIVGMLHHIWSWADSQSQDGHIKRVTEKWLDRFVHCDGFSKSLESAKWLVISSEGIEFPNFGKHNGESAKKRAEAAERQRLSRELKDKKGVTDMSHKTCDESVTREEKRREENKDQKQDQKPLSPDKPDDGMFSKFWSVYPNKKAKGSAEKAWIKIKPDQPLFERIIQAVMKQRASEDWVKDGGKFIPHPASWLNAKRWDDEIKASAGLSKTSGFSGQRNYQEGLHDNGDGTYGF